MDDLVRPLLLAAGQDHTAVREVVSRPRGPRVSADLDGANEAAGGASIGAAGLDADALSIHPRAHE